MTALLLYSDTTLASVEQRIVFKILLLTFKSLNDLVPSYIRDLLETYTPSRNLRSSTSNLLVTPRSRLKFFFRVIMLFWSVPLNFGIIFQSISTVV